jgi:hypothetical protein
MLGMKAWLEMKWRFVFGFVMVLVVLWAGASGGGLHTAQNAHNLIAMLSLISTVFAIQLAGDGIKTHPAFRRTQGLHGSLYFTLSLPVSRWRLLLVRAGSGLLEFGALTVLGYSLAWLAFPLVRGDSGLVDLCELILAVIVCSTCFYFVSVLLATFLDDAWQTWGGLLLFGAVRGLTERFHSAAWFNVTGFASGSHSPLVTHQLPWSAMAFSIAVSGLLLLAELKIVQSQEY